MLLGPMTALFRRLKIDKPRGAMGGPQSNDQSIPQTVNNGNRRPGIMSLHD